MENKITPKEFTDFLSTIGYAQYYGIENCFVKDNHTITIESDLILFEDMDTSYQDYEDIGYFENTSDLSCWIDGILQFIEEEEMEDE
jgi:hypothetical protein